MKKGRKVKRMINPLLFEYPNFKPAVSKDLISPNVSQIYEAGKLIWGSLLGKNKKEIETASLLNSPKFIVYVEKVRQDFIANRSNFRKYPKLNESDWK